MIPPTARQGEPPLKDSLLCRVCSCRDGLRTALVDISGKLSGLLFSSITPYNGPLASSTDKYFRLKVVRTPHHYRDRLPRTLSSVSSRGPSSFGAVRWVNGKKLELVTFPATILLLRIVMEIPGVDIESRWCELGLKCGGV